MRIIEENFRDMSGGSAVEVGLLSLLIVPICFYAVFFFEYSFVNIKLSEAARYAAWEMTVMPLTDWKTHQHSTSQIDSIKDEVQALWGDDLNSATSQDSTFAKGKDGNGIFSEKVTPLWVTSLDNASDDGSASEERIISSFADESPYSALDTVDSEGNGDGDGGNDGGFLGKLTGEIYNFTGKAASAMYSYFGFNTNGAIELAATVPLKFNVNAPLYKSAENGLLTTKIPSLQSRERIVIDAWDLKDGGDVDLGPAIAANPSGNASYYYQVKSMMFGGITGSLSQLLNGDDAEGGEFWDKVVNGLQSFIRLPWEPIVRSYALKEAPLGTGVKCSSGQKNKQACFNFGKSRFNPLGGDGEDQGVGALNKVYTNVFKDTYKEDSSPYNHVYRKSGSGYYMGCDVAQASSIGECWK